MCSSDIFLGFLAILFPPIAVWVKRGICSADSLINLGLCCLGILPGLLHAWYIIAQYPELPYDYQRVDQDTEAGGGAGGATVTYYYAQGPVPAARGQGPPKGYGTVNPERQFPGQQSSGAVNSFGQGGKVQGQGLQGGVNERAGEGRSGGAGGEGEVPPTYSEAIKGDHKVQRQE